MDPTTVALVFDHLPEPVVILENGVIQHRNRAWAGKFGESTPLVDCFHPDDHTHVTNAYTAARREPTHFTAKSAGSDAKQQNCSVWSVNDSLVVLRAVEIETPTCDEILASPEKTLQWIYRHTDTAIWTTRKDGTITVSHGPALALVGLGEGQMVGANAFEVYPPDSQVLDVTKRTLAGEKIHHMTNDGVVAWNQFCVPMRDPAGDIVAMVGLGTALSLDAAKINAGERLLDIVNDLPVVVWTMTVDGRCTLSAGKLLEQLGAKPGQLVGQNLFELYESAPDFIECFHRALAGESFMTEQHIGEATYATHFLPEKNLFGNVVGIYSVTQDITAIRRAEAEVREHEKQLDLQAKALAEAVSPIIEVWQGVLVVPLIGTLEHTRASLLTGKLLDDVVRHGATYTILDLTGVENVDAETANHLFQIMRSVELLGCSCLVSGIRGSVAQTMVALDVPMQAQTYPTLAGALRSCIRKTRT